MKKDGKSLEKGMKTWCQDNALERELDSASESSTDGQQGAPQFG